MANGFCTSCGKPLNDNTKFCTTCGAPIQNDKPPQSYSAEQRPNQQPTVQSAFQPGPMPAVQATSQIGTAQASGKKPNTGLLIGLIVAAVIVIVIAAFFLVKFFVLDNSDSKTANPPSASSSSSITSSDEASSTEVQNALKIYEEMGALDERISACATEFNENSLKPDRALRERCAKTAEQVYQDAISLQTNISAMSTGGAHELGEDTSHLRTLGNDLVKRIEVIDASWKRSLEFSDPAPHESYIIAPIAADNVGGVNKYYKDFKENYPNWKPGSK